MATENDPINPDHYRSHPSGVECIHIAREFSFCLGNVIKYVWRAGLKTRDPLQDLRKAERYLQEEIARLEKLAQHVKGPPPNPLYPDWDEQYQLWYRKVQAGTQDGQISPCGNYRYSAKSETWGSIKEFAPGPEKQFDNAPRAAHDGPTNGGAPSPEVKART